MRIVEEKEKIIKNVINRRLIFGLLKRGEREEKERRKKRERKDNEKIMTWC